MMKPKSSHCVVWVQTLNSHMQGMMTSSNMYFNRVYKQAISDNMHDNRPKMNPEAVVVYLVWLSCMDYP